MKVTSNSGSTGYSWIIDDKSCDGIVSIETGYVYYPADDESGFDVGYGEEIFTITKEDFGECTFRAAYAQPWAFSGFEDHVKNNGYIISIPIRVIEANDDNSGDNDFPDPIDEDDDD